MQLAHLRRIKDVGLVCVVTLRLPVCCPPFLRPSRAHQRCRVCPRIAPDLAPRTRNPGLNDRVPTCSLLAFQSGEGGFEPGYRLHGATLPVTCR
jgi:hypothetical protein